MDQQEMHQAAANGVAKYLEWRQKFLSDWGAAIQRGELGTAFASIPPQLRDAMKNADPATYEKLAGSLSKRT